MCTAVCRAIRSDIGNPSAHVAIAGIADAAGEEYQRPDHCQDYISRMVKLDGFAEPYKFRCWMRNPRYGDRPQRVTYAVPLPHEIITSIYEYNYEMFERVVASPEKIRRFWQGADVANDPAFVGCPGDPVHPCLLVPNYEQCVVVCGVHVDDAPFLRSRAGISCWSLSSLLGTGTSIETRFCGAIYPASKKYLVRFPAARNTVRRILFIFIWSLRCLASGTNPWTGADNEEFDPDSLRYKRRGQSIAGGLKFFCIQGRADLKAHFILISFSIARMGHSYSIPSFRGKKNGGRLV